jgi:VWFA-related protein
MIPGTSRIGVLSFACVAACVGLSGALLVAQAATDSVTLDVVVTDDDGRPVEGLDQAQFRITENRRAVAVTSFGENALAGTTGPHGGRSVTLILDDTGIPPQLTSTVQKIARRFLEKSTQSDRVSVLRLTHRADELVWENSISLSRIANYRGGMVPLFGRETFENVLTRVKVISQQLDTADPLRHVIVCIGSPEVFDINEPFSGKQSLIWSYWTDAIRAASRANAAVYVIDPAGASRNFKIRGSASLTAQTGGVSYVNSNAFESAVDRIWSEASHYYVLGYDAPRAATDLREIDVRVTAPGVHTRARKNRG